MKSLPWPLRRRGIWMREMRPPLTPPKEGNMDEGDERLKKLEKLEGVRRHLRVKHPSSNFSAKR